MLRNFIIRSLAIKPLVVLGGKAFRQYVPIFMLHRFACRQLDINGHELSLLWFALEFMRKRKFNFVSVEDIAESIRNNEPLPERSVAFSLDDGYWDQVEATGIVFAHFDCPATYFVTTGFINGDLWFWDAKIHYLVESASESQLNDLMALFPHLNFSGVARSDVAPMIVFDLTSLSIVDIENTIANLSSRLVVDIPEKVPDKYRGTTWQRLKDMERMGLKVGPHTYSHPLLSRENDEKSRAEILRSKEELALHISNPINVFCYPVGRMQDFGARDMEIVKDLGFAGAVSAIPGAVNTGNGDERFSMPRYSFPDTKADVVQYATWIESFKAKMRSQ